MPTALLLLLLPLAASQSLSVPMCPCVQTSSSCQKFDRRLQAYSLDEAMVAFPDLSLDDSAANYTVDEEAACSTPECQDCRKAIQQRAREVGLSSSSLDTFLASSLTNTTCSKYRFSNPHYSSSTRPSSSSSSSEDDDDDDDDDDKKERDEELKNKKHDKRNHNRNKRQIVSDGTIVGTRYTLSCTARGVASDVSGRVSLCGSCWVWRKLPDNYAPQYINELVCDTSDTTCLSGYASCSAGTHSVEVVRNDSGVLTTVALTAGSYCECKAEANSAIQSLVSGSGLPSAVPAVTTSNSSG